MRSERFFKNHLLPFAELRYSRDSTVPFKPHMHHTVSIGAVDQGQVLYTVNGKEAVLAPGSLVVINPETLHTCNPATETGRSYYMLSLDTDWCSQVQQSMWEVSLFVEFEKVRIDDEPLYRQYCQTMAHLMDAKIHLQEKEQMLFDLVCEVFSIACMPQAIKKARRDNIEKLKKILSADLQRDLPLNALAKEIDVNPYTLIRSFKAVTGITPHAYRMNCRIEQARALLRAGWDIAETALECGFFDQSHFHRHFKAMTTVTPQAYRVNFVQ
ncbi:MAG: AraC family transcriptional regulator [Desulfobacterales bacterium]|nr:AraC family transcriptional regulator [Desulfobacterales bacterium]